MLEFKKGNPEKLEGKVVVYAENLGLCGEERCAKLKYPYLFATANLAEQEEIKERVEELMSTELVEKLKEMGAPQEVLDALKDPENRPKIFPMACRQGEFDSLDEIKQMDADVIYAGKISCISMAMQCLMGIAQAYMMNYITQLEESVKTNGVVKPTFTDRYTNYSSDDFRKKLCELVGGLMDTINNQNYDAFNQIKANIVAFTRSSPFFPDVTNLIGIAQTGIRNKLNVMDLYVEKIVAICAEDYKKAGQLDKKIKEASGQ